MRRIRQGRKRVILCVRVDRQTIDYRKKRMHTSTDAVMQVGGAGVAPYSLVLRLEMDNIYGRLFWPLSAFLLSTGKSERTKGCFPFSIQELAGTGNRKTNALGKLSIRCISQGTTDAYRCLPLALDPILVYLVLRSG